MNKKVVYFCGGRKPVIELLVSIFSLRKYYSGEIVVFLGETSVPYLRDNLLKNKDINTIIVPNTSNDMSVRDHWKSRWVAMSMIDDGIILHPDCDIVYTGNIDKAFDAVKKEKNWMTSFHTVNDGQDYERWQNHVEEYKKIDKNFNITKPFYIEFGLVGWINNWEYCMQTAEACKIVKDDQTAMSYVIMKNGRKAHLAEFKNPILRRARNYYKLTKEQFDDVLLWHCHQEYAFWWNEFLEASKQNYMNLGSMAYVRELNRRVRRMIKFKTYPTITYTPT